MRSGYDPEGLPQSSQGEGPVGGRAAPTHESPAGLIAQGAPSIGYSVLEGGIPIVANGKIHGSVGVSGSVTPQQDAQIGQAGIDALK